MMPRHSGLKRTKVCLQRERRGERHGSSWNRVESE